MRLQVQNKNRILTAKTFHMHRTVPTQHNLYYVVTQDRLLGKDTYNNQIKPIKRHNKKAFPHFQKERLRKGFFVMFNYFSLPTKLLKN